MKKVAGLTTILALALSGTAFAGDDYGQCDYKDKCQRGHAYAYGHDKDKKCDDDKDW